MAKKQKFLLNYWPKVLKMNDFKKDVMIGIIFMAGLYSFVSGEFIISNVLFASAAIATKVDLNKKCE
jgi:hypothetical protein